MTATTEIAPILIEEINVMEKPKKKAVKKTKKVKEVKVEIKIYDAMLKEKIKYIKQCLLKVANSNSRKDKKRYKELIAQLVLYQEKYTDNIDDILF